MKFQCTQCNQLLQADDEDMGGAIICFHCHQETPIPAAHTEAGVLIDDFLINRLLGEGGMGSVYLAYQLSLDRQVALKILRTEFTRDGDFIVGFIKEARNAAKLNHPNIIQAYAVGQDEGLYFIAMELIEGKSVHEILSEIGPLDIEWTLQVIQKVALGLDHAWNAQQLVHRDIKPDNIMIRSRDGEVKLADLGLAKAASELVEEEDDDEFTATPQYLCPENLIGETMDIRGDIYSLGATMFHMLTGRFPFEGDSGIEIAQKHLNEELQSPLELREDIPRSVAAIICKMMEKDPDDRYLDCAALVKDLDRELRRLRSPNEPRKKKKKRRVGGATTSINISSLNKPATTDTATTQTTIYQPPAGMSTGKKVAIALVILAFIAITAVALIVASKTPPSVPGPGTSTTTTTPGGNKAPSIENMGDKEFEALLSMVEEARAYAEANPDDFDGQIDRYKKIRTAGIGTKFGENAHSEIMRLRDEKRAREGK
jgi:serine/threonine protein kinase